MADAGKEVMKHYSFGMSEKRLAWINLTVVCGGIYGTRMMAWGIRKRAEPPKPKAAAPSSPSSPPPPNGHAAAHEINLTPAFMTAPVVDEIP